MPEPEYTTLAVAIGKLQAGLDNALGLLGDIKESQSRQDVRLGDLEVRQAAVEERLKSAEKKLADNAEERSENRRAHWQSYAAWSGVGAALLMGLYGVLNQLWA